MEKHTIESVKEKLKIFDDANFVFDPVKHVYTYEGEVMRGTTSFLHNFVKPFDSDYWSKKKANDAGITQEEILAQWDAKRDRSCDLGHMVHDYIEHFYEENSTQLTEDEEANARIAKFHTIYDARLSALESVGSEIKVFSKKWNLAGTIDKIYIYENSIVLGDWKTNKEIKTDKSFCFGKLLPPFEKYKDNELNKYSLQLSIYALLLEEAGIYVDYCFICHIPDKGDAEIYKLKDFRAELRAYFTHQFLITEVVDVEKEKELVKLEVIW